MTTRAQIQRLAEQDGLTFEEAEDILFDAAELENDRRRDDALFNPPPQHPLHNLKEAP